MNLLRGPHSVGYFQACLQIIIWAENSTRFKPNCTVTQNEQFSVLEGMPNFNNVLFKGVSKLHFCQTSVNPSEKVSELLCINNLHNVY